MLQHVHSLRARRRAETFDDFAQQSPLLALAMFVFLLSLGGIPFVALYGLVFVGAVLTVFALYYYLVVARRMYIEALDRPEPIWMPGLLGVAIAICAIGVVGGGVYPAPWVALAQRIAATLFS